MGRLGNHPAALVSLFLQALDCCPGRNKIFCSGGRWLQRTKDHETGRRFAIRPEAAAALAGPLLEGGFFIPSSNSFKATALLRSASFEAYTRVTLECSLMSL